jgi:hypothetical protein
MKNGFPLKISVIAILVVGLFLWGCAAETDLPTQISGKWKLEKGDKVVEVNLTKDPKTVVIDGQSYPAVIEKIDKDTFMVDLQVETAAGKKEVWSLRQVWNDNGSTFRLAFSHDGVHEVLQSADKTS